ncbi:T9SS type A sorting domain-containing protein [Flavobacterium sp.]|uniref:T9SS type A sorting domain-containing protein n=1 Tax=Flavobacterium sp. TaxID=239 RepID=UPI0039E31029
MKKLFLFLLFLTTATQAQQLQSITYQNWENAHWQDWFKQEITYDAEGFAVQHLYKVWDEATLAWLSSSQTLMTNNASGLPTVLISQSWMAETNSWENASRFTYTYNEQNQTASLNFETWQDGNWLPNWRDSYTHDANHFLTELFTQVWNTDLLLWENSTKVTYTNDANGNQLQSVNEQWNQNAWVNSQKVTSTFNGLNQQTTALTQNWNGSVWENAGRSQYTYDANQLIGSLFQNWQADVNNWIDNNRGQYTYNPDDTMAQYIIQMWQNNQWVNFQKAIYTYNPLGVAENPLAEIGFFPNPVHDHLYFVGLDGQTVNNLRVIDLQGRMIPIHANQQTIDVSGLPTGVYLLQFERNGQTVSQKLLKN